MRVDEAELTRWGQVLGAGATPPLTLALVGPLGAGKSVLARAIGAGAGVSDPMPSPSYNLLFRYRTPSDRHVVHLDLYRLDAPDELWELGWASLGSDDEIVIIEWPERAGELMPGDHWVIELSHVEGSPELRDVTLTRVGQPAALPETPVARGGAVG